MNNIFSKILLLSGLLCASQLFAQNDKAVIDKIIASVGGEIVLYSELQEQLAYMGERQPKLPPDYQCMALQSIIVQKLLVNQAKLDSIEVKDEEVQSQLDARNERLLGLFNQDQKALEEYYGMTLDQIKEQLRGDMRSQILAERMQKTIIDKVTVTPAEVKEFFNNIPKDSLPYFNSEVEIKEIMLKPVVNETQKAIARQKVEDLYKRITEGKESFEELAKKYSEDLGSGKSGGDLGFQKRGVFVPAFEAAVYKLEKDQVSSIVETEFGFHIIQLIERRGNLVHARHILIKPEITAEDYKLAENKLDSIRTLITSGKITFSEGVKRFGDKNAQSFNNDGRVLNPKSGNTFFEMADLPTNIFFAVESLKVGEISKPVESAPDEGEKFYRLVLLQNRSKPHKANLKQDYNKIQTAALEQKKATYIDKWMVEKLRSTYLIIDPIYDSCTNLQIIVEESRKK